MRYTRQVILPEIGVEGQEKLLRARVLVVGAGGLGSPLLLYLAAAGVGTLGIVDWDMVSESNLQRQILYTEADLGKPKTERAAARLQALNSNLKIVKHNCRLDASNAKQIIKDYDIVADACDNFETRYLLNDACLELNIPYIYGAIDGFCGQVSVFAYGDSKRSFRELFPDPEELGQLPEQKAVIAPCPGVIGSLQATEAIKIITGAGQPLSGKLMVANLLTAEIQIIET